MWVINPFEILLIDKHLMITSDSAVKNVLFSYF